MIAPITFYNESINNDLVSYQKKIFNHFSIPLNQIYCKEWVGHGQIIDNYLKSMNNNWEYFILFDIDCIPLDNSIINEGLEWSKNNLGLFSVAQRHYRKSEIVYASPAFLIFSKKTYDTLQRPSFVETRRSDVGGELSHKCIELGLPLNLMYPSEVEDNRWILTKNQKFGIGTTYNGRIYHAFESRFNNTSNFVNKCKTILNEK